MGCTFKKDTDRYYLEIAKESDLHEMFMQLNERVVFLFGSDVCEDKYSNFSIIVQEYLPWQ